MSSKEFTQWQAFFSIEPFPELRADRRAADIQMAILAAAGVKQLPKLSQLMPDWWGEFHVKQQTPEQMKAAMESFMKRKKKK